MAISVHSKVSIVVEFHPGKKGKKTPRMSWGIGPGWLH